MAGVLFPTSVAAAPHETVISSCSNGSEFGDGLGASDTASISSDGRFVTFQSEAPNLVMGDANAQLDVFVRDHQTNTTTIVSRSSGVGPPDANGMSHSPAISADGRFVSFVSDATNLVADDENGKGDIFVRDLRPPTGEPTTTVVSRPSGSESPNANNESGGAPGGAPPAISADGRFVAFQSAATNLVTGDANNQIDVFLRDLQLDTTTIASRPSGTGPLNANGQSDTASISADGRFVAFQSAATNLVTGDANHQEDVFVRDHLTNTTTIVSRASDVASPDANGSSTVPAISADGRFVAFQSAATNLVTGDANNQIDVFLRDLQLDTTTIASRPSGTGPPNADGPSDMASISADGRLVAFRSDATNLVAGDVNRRLDIFVRDLRPPTGEPTTTVVSRSSGPGPPDAMRDSFSPEISADGQFVVFDSEALLVVPEPNGIVRDVFRRELAPHPVTPSLSIDNRTVTEGDAGEVNAIFTVALSAQSAQPVTVDFATANDSATAPADYTAQSGMLTFAAGETSRTVTVKVKGDTLDEPSERFFVNLSSPVNATIADAQGAGTITDDDPPADAAGAGPGSAPDGDSAGKRHPTEPDWVGCVESRGGVAGNRLGSARLGRSRKAQRRDFAGAKRDARREGDRYCLAGGGTLTIGYPTHRLMSKLGRSVRRRLGDRAILLLTSSPRYAIRGIGLNTGTRILTRRLPGVRRLRIGRNDWYLAPGRGSRLVFRARGGRVVELGLASTLLTRERRGARLLLSPY